MIGLSWVGALSCTDSGPRRPSILLVLIDTLRRDHCSAYGYPHETTPTLTRIAQRGVTFTSAYAPTATTGPSTVSLFTSLYPITHGYLKNGLTLGGGAVTLAELLGSAGYQTHAVVSSPVLATRLGMLQGFDTTSDRWPKTQSSWQRGPNRMEPTRYEYDRRARYSVDEMLRWLDDRRDRKRPFFAFLHLMDPHEPYDPPDEHRQRLLGVREGLSHQELLELDYDSDIAYADAELGRLLTEIERATQGEGLLVLVVGDHGQGLNDHGWLGHGVHLYEESVAIPFVAMYPGVIAPGTTIEEAVGLLDVAPTTLAYAGLEVTPGRLQGKNLRAAIEGTKALPRDRPVYLQRRSFESKRGPDGRAIEGDKFGLVWQGFKYIEAKREGTFELYDLGTDPHERTNLFEQQRRQARKMAAALARWRAAYETPPEIRGEGIGPVPDADQDALRALGYLE